MAEYTKSLENDSSDDICSNHHRGNSNSIAANKRLRPHKKSQRTIVLDFITWAKDGVTCEDICSQLNLKHQSVSARISELKIRNQIKISGERFTSSKNTSSIYVANISQTSEGDDR